MDKKGLQEIIRKAISNKEKIILKENLKFNNLAVTENDVIIDLSNLNKIIELDKENFTVTVEAGINFLELQMLLQEKGFYFPMDTYASAQTSLAYNILHALPSYTLGQHGNYREFVLGVDLVLLNGNCITIGGKNIKNVSGLDIIGLMIGSKEALGLITSCTLRLLPLPEEKRVVMCKFENLETALKAAGRLTDLGINPVRLQVINKGDFLFANNKEFAKTPVLIAEFEGFKASMERKVDVFKNKVSQSALSPCLDITDPMEIKSFWDNFRENQYQLLANSASSILFSSFMSNLPEMIGELDKEVLKSYSEYNLFVNALNGSAMLINMQKVDIGWSNIVGKTFDKYQVNLLGGRDFKYPGLNIIRDRLLKAFDPNGISFFGGEKV